MTQIHRYSILLMILAFSCTCILGTRRPVQEENDPNHAHNNSRYRWEQVRLENRCGDSGSINEAKYYKYCFYPHDDNVPRGCRRYVFFGNSTKGDKEIFKQKFKKTDSKQAPVVTKIEYFQNNATNAIPINMIAMETTNGNTRVHRDKICIRKGGINGTFVEIIAESKYIYGSDGYVMTVWGKSKSVN